MLSLLSRPIMSSEIKRNVTSVYLSCCGGRPGTENPRARRVSACKTAQNGGAEWELGCAGGVSSKLTRRRRHGRDGAVNDIRRVLPCGNSPVNACGLPPSLSVGRGHRRLAEILINGAQREACCLPELGRRQLCTGALRGELIFNGAFWHGNARGCSSAGTPLMAIARDGENGGGLALKLAVSEKWCYRAPVEVARKARR